MYPVSERTSERMPSTATATQETKTTLPTSTAVELSDEAMSRYQADQSPAKANDEESENPLQQVGRKMAEKVDSSNGSDSVAETLARLEEMLKEALKRLTIAKQQMAKIMAEMNRTEDITQKIAVLTKVQAAQVQVISASSEVMLIQQKIHMILVEQRKATAKAANGG